jgi:hypothetical protein
MIALNAQQHCVLPQLHGETFSAPIRRTRRPIAADLTPLPVGCDSPPRVPLSALECPTPGRSRHGVYRPPGCPPRLTRRDWVVPSKQSLEVPSGKLVEHDRLSRRNEAILVFIRTKSHISIDRTSQ